MSVSHFFSQNKKILSIFLGIFVIGTALVFSVDFSRQSADAQPAVTQATAAQPVRVKTLASSSAGQKVRASGVVEARMRATVAAETSGVISNVAVEIGDQLGEGAVIATFANAQQQAGVSSAQARLSQLQNGARPVELANAGLQREQSRMSRAAAAENLREVRRNQSQAVADAEEALLNTDLQAYLENERGEEVSTRRSLAAPQISGVYSATEQGVYRIELYRSGTNSGASFRYSGLEHGRGIVSTETPQPLGDRGLYIQFPENFSIDRDVTWVVGIPNERSGQYLRVKNAYENAQQTRDSQIRQAQTALDNAINTAEQSANNLEIARSGARAEEIAAQQAQVDSARAQLEQTIVRAPFSGTILSLSATAGEYKSPGQEIVRMVNENNLEIQTYVPAEIARQISVGDTAMVSGEFRAEVIAIAPAIDPETGNVGVRLRLPDQTGIISGSYVELVFQIYNSSVDVSTLPLSAVATDGAGSYVYIISDGVAQRFSVETGVVVDESIKVIGDLPSEDIIADIAGITAGQSVSADNQETQNE